MTWADLWLQGLQVNVSWYEGSEGLGADFATSLSGTTNDELKRTREGGSRDKVDGIGLRLDDCIN